MAKNKKSRNIKKTIREKQGEIFSGLSKSCSETLRHGKQAGKESLEKINKVANTGTELLKSQEYLKSVKEKSLKIKEKGTEQSASLKKQSPRFHKKITNVFLYFLENIPRSQLKIGTYVRIEEGSGSSIAQFDGKISEILTGSEIHPHGTLVKLDSGKTGRVKKILTGDVPESPHSENPGSIQTPKITIPESEDQTSEFKSTFRADLARLEKGDGKLVTNKEVAKEISVTISAMANSSGGTLFLGIRDNGEIIGLSNDYKLLENCNDDKFERTLWQSIQDYLQNRTFETKLAVSLHSINDKKICVIEVPVSNKAIFVHDANQESYVRIGPKSEKFPPKDFLDYCKEHFGE